MRVQAEDQAREELSNEIALRLRGETLLRQAAERAVSARETSRSTVRRGASATELLAAHAWVERSHRSERDAELALDRRDAEVSARREALVHASRQRQSIDKLADRRRDEHVNTWARRAQGELDEIALTMHRRGSAVR